MLHCEFTSIWITIWDHLQHWSIPWISYSQSIWSNFLNDLMYHGLFVQDILDLYIIFWYVRWKVIVWQRFCEPARLRIAYCPWLAGWLAGWLSCPTSAGNLLLHNRTFCSLLRNVKVIPITNPGKSVNWLLLVTSIPLCQTSCPLRTVH